MIDSHCHLDLSDFDNDRDDILNDCSRLGISRILLPGLFIEQFDHLLSLSQHWPQLDIAFGLHPYFLRELDENAQHQLFGKLETLAYRHQNKIVAIGECGIDTNITLSIDYQVQILSMQIKLASELKLPLILHHRQSHNILIRLLKQLRFTNGGVIHAFSGSHEIAQSYIDLGFCLGVGGTITYPRAQKTRNTIQEVLLEHLLLETDAPDMPVNGYQGQRNSPSQLPLIAQSLAELRGIDLEEVLNQTDSNYYRLFR